MMFRVMAIKEPVSTDAICFESTPFYSFTMMNGGVSDSLLTTTQTDSTLRATLSFAKQLLCFLGRSINVHIEIFNGITEEHGGCASLVSQWTRR